MPLPFALNAEVILPEPINFQQWLDKDLAFLFIYSNIPYIILYTISFMYFFYRLGNCNFAIKNMLRLPKVKVDLHKIEKKKF